MKDLKEKNCTTCKNAKWCLYIHPYVGRYCPGMERIIDNTTPLKEPLASDLIGEGYDGFVDKSYSEVLTEIGENKETEHSLRHDQIMDMPENTLNELRIKAISALLFFGISHSKIMRMLHVAERTFYRMVTGK